MKPKTKRYDVKYLSAENYPDGRKYLSSIGFGLDQTYLHETNLAIIFYLKKISQ